MNKRLFFVIVMLFAFAAPAMAYDFSAVAPSGQTLYYNIMNGEAQVTDNGSYNVFFTSGNDYIVGDIVIPSTVTYNDVEYTVTSIGSNAFYGCSYITSIVLPNTLTSIGSQSFYGCRIANLIVPDGVTSIGNWAFVSIRHIEYHGYATYNSNYRYWNAGSMNGYTEGDFVYSNDSKTHLWAYIGNDESVTIPSTVSSIGRRAFEYCSNLTSVTLHNGITSIGEYAFLRCENLNSVNIPGSVSSIGNGAFNNTGIVSATINDGVESIGDYAFEGCSKLTSINIPNSVTNIGRGAFMEDTILATVTIGTGLSTIEPLTFYYCYNLSSIEIHSPITYIGGSAFIDCWSLTEFEIPSTVTTIAGDVFSHCTGIVSMTIPSTVTSIGNNAFERIRHIEYHGEATGAPWGALSMNGVVDGDFVYSDDTKTVLVGYVGYGGTVVVPSTVNTIVAKTFAYGESITSVTIPNTVLSIGDSTFFFCRNMLFANIPDYVMEIREATFYDCFSLDSVYIGESVASIGDYSFYLCAHLSSINARPIAPPSIGSNSVSHVPSNVKIIVPCGKVADYQAANGWSRFTNIQEVGGCIPAGPTNIAVYADGNDIVVEGATGNTVTLYDNTGNTLATSIAPAGTPLRFEALDSGTYFIKIGILPARMKVEVQ